MQHCPNCGGGEFKIIATILERSVIEKILTHLGLDPQPPPKGRPPEAAQDSRSTLGSESKALLAASCKRSIACRISATRGCRRPILALHAAAARSSGLTWALLSVVKNSYALLWRAGASRPTRLVVADGRQEANAKQSKRSPTGTAGLAA
jgi:hypothetical protein